MTGEALTRSEEKGEWHLPFGEFLSHHTDQLKTRMYTTAFMLWHLLVLFYVDWIYNNADSLPWIVFIVDFGLGYSTNPFSPFLFLSSCFSSILSLSFHHLFHPLHVSFISFPLRAKDMKNRLAFLRRRNESPGSNPASKLDKSMKSVK